MDDLDFDEFDDFEDEDMNLNNNPLGGTLSTNPLAGKTAPLLDLQDGVMDMDGFISEPVDKFEFKEEYEGGVGTAPPIKEIEEVRREVLEKQREAKILDDIRDRKKLELERYKEDTKGVVHRSSQEFTDFVDEAADNEDMRIDDIIDEMDMESQSKDKKPKGPSLDMM